MVIDRGVVDAKGQARAARVEVSDSGPPWQVSVCVDENIVAGVGPDLFEALSIARLQLEELGFLLCCNGARIDVFPSGMSRGMSGGKLAYQLRIGKQAKRRQLVDILDPASAKKVGTVEQQRDYFDRWLGSLT